MKYITLTFAALLAACSSAQSAETPARPDVQLSGEKDTAILAGGCFWCVESDFEKLAGVYEAVSGYSGGDMQNPTYRNHGQHVEVAKITFDPTVISYEEVLDYYWRHVDPTDNGGQFCDRGNAYIPVIYARPDQLAEVKASKAEIEDIKPFAAPIRVPILPAKTFWKAEEYHQDYYLKNPAAYNRYRKGCRRDAVVKSLWESETKAKANTSYGSGN